MTQNAEQPSKPSVSAQNQRAGKLNLSPRVGALDYLSSQHEQAIEEESRRAAKEFREKKRRELLEKRGLIEEGQDVDI